MRLETFSEYCAGRRPFFRTMDTRAKLVFGVLCIALAIAAGDPLVPVFVGALCLFVLLVSGAPPRAAALRMAEPLFFAAALALFQAFLVPGDAVFALDVSGLSLTATTEGMARGAAILARVFGAVSVVLFVTMTTPAHRLLSAAARLRVPGAFVEVALFAYRYVFVLLEDAVTIYQAQKGRLGYTGFSRGVRSLGTLCGSVFLRAFLQAEATGAAMAQRGYTGEYIPAFRERLRLGDAAFLCGLLTMCTAVEIWTL